jgi:copper chaperone CopZ
MKIFSSLIILLFITAINSNAQDSSLASGTYKVYGNCGMCKATIEKAAKSVKGVESAEWDVKSDTITVTYNIKKTDPDKILQAIAESGYDSDTHRAPDEAYNKLHGCCQYDRPKKEQ